MRMLTKISNAQGVRILKPIIKQANLENSEIEFEVTKDGLLLKPVKKSVRKDWKKDGLVLLDQIRTVDKKRLVKKLGVVEEKKAKEISKTLVEMFEY